MKLRQHSIMRLIYACLLAIPMVSVLSRVIYTQSNKNAIQSYSGNDTYAIKTEKPSNDVTDVSSLVSGNYYHFEIDLLYADESFEIDCTEIQNKKIWVAESNNATYSVSSNHTKFEYINDTHRVNLVFSDLYDDVTGDVIKYVGFQWREQQSYSITFDAKFFNWVGSTTQFGNRYKVTKATLYNEQIVEKSNLDNAFDYSLSKFVSDNDFGKLNLFEWFWNIFLTQNQQNKLYIQFVNWYMNYVLCVSSAYILFMVLMWFINYSRRIMERGLDYDW